jgi:hypothetical protein
LEEKKAFENLKKEKKMSFSRKRSIVSAISNPPQEQIQSNNNEENQNTLVQEVSVSETTHQHHHQNHQPQSESPFTRWRQLRNDPHFIAAVTDFCDYEDRVRYEIALDYASWWPSNVRNFRFELLIILERDISIEVLIEREGRKQIEVEQEEDFYFYEAHWRHKQLFAFWPRWIEFAHSVICAQMWTQESVIRNEFTHRMQIVDRSEVQERAKIYETILGQIHSVGILWGDFVPEKIRVAREAEAKRVAEIQAAQERDVEILRRLYMKQIQEILKQKYEDLMTTWEAGRARIQWKAEQQFDVIVHKCFEPSSSSLVFDRKEEAEADDDERRSNYSTSPSVSSSRQRNRKMF